MKRKLSPDKRSSTPWAALALIGALCAAIQAGAAPRLQFEQTLIDFGKTSQVASVSGVFKFKNTGDAILKLEPPKPSCGCTVAEFKPDTLPPGASGELPFTLSLGPLRAVMEKHIAVRSNDPQTPDVSLTIKVDYTPLYEFVPQTLAPILAFGVSDDVQSTTLSRTDGKPLRIARLDTSKPWITAAIEPGGQPDASTARVRVSVQREGTPRRFNEFVQVYATDQTNTPAASIYIYGQFMGEVSLSPEALYWSITDGAKAAAKSPEDLTTRRVTIRSATGGKFELKNPQSAMKGVKIELVPKESGKAYELVARLDELPAKTVSGNVSFETSVPAQPRIEVPIVVNVFKP